VAEKTLLLAMKYVPAGGGGGDAEVGGGGDAEVGGGSGGGGRSGDGGGGRGGGGDAEAGGGSGGGGSTAATSAARPSMAIRRRPIAPAFFTL